MNKQCLALEASYISAQMNKINKLDKLHEQIIMIGFLFQLGKTEGDKDEKEKNYI